MLLLSTGIWGCGKTSDTKGSAAETSTASSSEKIIIRVGGVFAEEHPIAQGLEIFKKKLEEKTDNVEVQIFHNCALGSERAMAEGCQTGEIQMVSSGPPGLGLFVPASDVVELPYIYKDRENALKSWDALIDTLNEQAVPGGIRVLGAFDQGVRAFISNKPINSVGDFKGYNFRCPPSELYTGLAKELRANPISVAFPEVYTALQTNLVDGMEGPPATIWSMKFYEPCKYLVLTDHIICGQYFFINEDFYKSLPKDVQEKLTESVKEACVEQRVISAKSESEFIQKIADKGVKVIDIEDLTPFREKLKNYPMKYAKTISDDAVKLLQEILDMNK